MHYIGSVLEIHIKHSQSLERPREKNIIKKRVKYFKLLLRSNKRKSAKSQHKNDCKVTWRQAKVFVSKAFLHVCLVLVRLNQ